MHARADIVSHEQAVSAGGTKHFVTIFSKTITLCSKSLLNWTYMIIKRDQTCIWVFQESEV